MDEKDIFNTLQNKIKEQVKDAYLAGAREGTLMTAATMYGIFNNMGLPKDNIVFDILRDIAHKNGCDDLEVYFEKVKIKTEEPRDEYLS